MGITKSISDSHRHKYTKPAKIKVLLSAGIKLGAYDILHLHACKCGKLLAHDLTRVNK